MDTWPQLYWLKKTTTENKNGSKHINTTKNNKGVV